MSCTLSVDFVIKKQKNRTHFPLTFFQSGSYCLLSTCSVPGRVTGHRPATRMTRRDFPPHGIKDHESHEDREGTWKTIFYEQTCIADNTILLTSLIIRETHIRWQWSIPFHRLRWLLSKIEESNIGEFGEKRKLEYYGWSSHCGKEYRASPQKIKNRISIQCSQSPSKCISTGNKSTILKCYLQPHICCRVIYKD